MTKVGITMTNDQEMSVVSCLKANLDVFAWEPIHLKGIDLDVVCHRLALHLKAKSIAQRKRRFEEENRRAIVQETKRLCVVGFIRELNPLHGWLMFYGEKGQREMVDVHRSHELKQSMP